MCFLENRNYQFCKNRQILFNIRKYIVTKNENIQYPFSSYLRFRKAIFFCHKTPQKPNLFPRYEEVFIKTKFSFFASDFRKSF